MFEVHLPAAVRLASTEPGAAVPVADPAVVDVTAALSVTAQVGRRREVAVDDHLDEAEKALRVTVENTGDTPIRVTGWYLVSESGARQIAMTRMLRGSARIPTVVDPSGHVSWFVRPDAIVRLAADAGLARLHLEVTVESRRRVRGNRLVVRDVA